MELPDYLNYYQNVKILDNGRYAAIDILLSAEAIITGQIIDQFGYDDRWFYERGKAAAALEAWNGEGEPEGWFRHPDTGRRRPGGDPDKEYINF